MNPVMFSLGKVEFRWYSFFILIAVIVGFCLALREGKKRKIELLKHFGDLESIKKASIDEIKEVKGMNEKASTNVYEYFHNEN